MKVYLVTAPRLVYLQALRAVGYRAILATMADSTSLAQHLIQNLGEPGHYTPPPAEREPR